MVYGPSAPLKKEWVMLLVKLHCQLIHSHFPKTFCLFPFRFMIFISHLFWGAVIQQWYCVIGAYMLCPILCIFMFRKHGGREIRYHINLWNWDFPLHPWYSVWVYAPPTVLLFLTICFYCLITVRSIMVTLIPLSYLKLNCFLEALCYKD